MDSNDEGKGSPGSEPAVELQRRASGAAQRAADLAAAGFPSFEAFKARTSTLYARVEKKLDAIPPERQQPPPPTIVAPAALQHALLGESDEVAELREMFENLVATSMDRETASNAHPAFVSIISQLTPDEARILKSIDRDEYPYLERNGRGGIITLLGAGTGINESQMSVYVTNLVRIGILVWHDGFAGDYAEAPPELIRLVEREFPDQGSRNTNLRGGALLSMHVTPFGRQFLDTCVRPRPSLPPPAAAPRTR